MVQHHHLKVHKLRLGLGGGGGGQREQTKKEATENKPLIFLNLVRKIKDLRLGERTENVKCGGSHIAFTEYQSQPIFDAETNPNS